MRCSASAGTATPISFAGLSPSFSAVLGTDRARDPHIDEKGVFVELGLNDHLTSQRSNGLASMVARIKRDALAASSTERRRQLSSRSARPLSGLQLHSFA